jgi:signal transduction histidine kinase
MGKLVEDASRAVQRIAMQLRPSLLDDLGLAAALEWQADKFAARTGIHCRWRHRPHDCRLPELHTIAVFRIFQEILTNVARHAQARNLVLDCTRKGNAQVWSVRDDGQGFDEAKSSVRTSLGLLGMRERAASIGAKVEIQSVPGQGTTVTLTVPFQAACPRTAVLKKAPRKKSHENSTGG